MLARFGEPGFRVCVRTHNSHVFVAPAFSVKCQDILYRRCQDILYTHSLGAFVVSCAEDAEGARRATGASSAPRPRSTTSAREQRRSRSTSRMYMCR